MLRDKIEGLQEDSERDAAQQALVAVEKARWKAEKENGRLTDELLSVDGAKGCQRQFCGFLGEDFSRENSNGSEIRCE